MLGPAIIPACQAIDDTAIAVGKTLRGTRLGARALNAGPEKARAIPREKATPNNAVKPRSPRQVSTPRTAAQQSWMKIVAWPMRRRSKRSATQPVTGVRKNSGTNWTRPIMPSRKALSRTDISSRARP